MALPPTTVNNNYFAENSVKLEDIQKALAASHAQDTFRYASGGVVPKATPYSNPCNEIIAGSISADQIKVGTITPGKLVISGDTELKSWRETLDIKAPMYKNNFETDFDENVWTIELPGIAKDRIEVFQVDHFLYVQIDEDKTKRLVRDLNEGETVKSTKLDLGILTIVIDRPNKRQVIEIG